MARIDPAIPQHSRHTGVPFDGEVPMKITTKKGERAHQDEEKILVGKTPNGRDVFVIMSAEDIKKHNVEQIKNSAMAYLKKHPGLTETKGAKLKVPLQPVSAREDKELSSTDSGIKAIASTIKPPVPVIVETAVTEPVLESEMEDPFKDFYFDRSSQMLSECQVKADKLYDKILGIIEDPDKIFIGELNILAEEILETLDDFSSIESSGFNVHFGLLELLTKKIDEIDQMIDESTNAPEKEAKDLDVKMLAIRKLVSEIRMVGLVPADGSILRFVVEDRAIRQKWSKCLAEKGQTAPYSVPFGEFYNKVILNIFPEMKDDEEFKRFMSDLMNFAEEENITAWTWNQYVELAGSVDEFRELVLQNKGNPDFIREYLTALSEVS